MTQVLALFIPQTNARISVSKALCSVSVVLKRLFPPTPLQMSLSACARTPTFWRDGSSIPVTRSPLKRRYSSFFLYFAVDLFAPCCCVQSWARGGKKTHSRCFDVSAGKVGRIFPGREPEVGRGPVEEPTCVRDMRPDPEPGQGPHSLGTHTANRMQHFSLCLSESTAALPYFPASSMDPSGFSSYFLSMSVMGQFRGCRNGLCLS